MVGLLMLSPSISRSNATTSKDQKAKLAGQQLIAPTVSAQEEGGIDPTGSTVDNSVSESAGENADTGNFFADNWGALLMGLLGFFDLVARLTPTEKDNSIINFLMSLFNTLVPNLKKGGGSFKLLSK